MKDKYQYERSDLGQVRASLRHLFVGQASIIKLLHKGAVQDLKGRLHKISADTSQSRSDSPPYYLVEIACPRARIPLAKAGRLSCVRACRHRYLFARTAAAIWTICLNPSVTILRKRCGNINFCFSHRMFPPIAVVKQFKGVTI